MNDEKEHVLETAIIRFEGWMFYSVLSSGWYFSAIAGFYIGVGLLVGWTIAALIYN